jgi:hypothetical protein
VYFLLRGVVGMVGRDFKSSLVMVSEEAATQQFCLHAYLQVAAMIRRTLKGW